MNIRLGLFIMVGLVAQNAFSMNPDQIRRSKDMINKTITTMRSGNFSESELDAQYNSAMNEAKSMEKMGISTKNLQKELEGIYNNQKFAIREAFKAEKLRQSADLAMSRSAARLEYDKQMNLVIADTNKAVEYIKDFNANAKKDALLSQKSRNTTISILDTAKSAFERAVAEKPIGHVKKYLSEMNTELKKLHAQLTIYIDKKSDTYWSPLGFFYGTIKTQAKDEIEEILNKITDLQVYINGLLKK